MPQTSTGEPTVAVVTRTRNRPEMLARALDSILAQSYGDLEVVVVNDAGDRATVEAAVAAVAERAASRVRVVHNEVSHGREAAMNTGVDASTAPLVVIHDDDDTWHPDFLARTVDHLATHPDHLGVAVRTEVVLEHRDGDRMVTDSTEVLAADVHDLTLARMVRRNYAPPISFLYRRSVHDAVGAYDGTLPVLADWDFMLRLLTHGPAGFLDGEPLARWHHRPTGTGDDGNSVIAARDDHEHYEHLIRDRYLRESLRVNPDLGLLLFGAKTVDDHERRVHSELDVLRAEIVQLGQSVHARLEALDGEQGTITATRLTLHRLEHDLVSQTNRFIARFDTLEAQLAQLHALSFSQTPRARASSYGRVARRGLRRLLRR